MPTGAVHTITVILRNSITGRLYQSQCSVKRQLFLLSTLESIGQRNRIASVLGSHLISRQQVNVAVQLAMTPANTGVTCTKPNLNAHLAALQSRLL